MILDNLKRLNRQDLIRSLQRMQITQIEIIEPYCPNDATNLTKLAKEMSQKSGDLSIILVRSS